MNLSLAVILQKLVSFQTEAENLAEKSSCFEMLTTELLGKKLYLKEYTSDGSPAVVFTTTPTRSPKLLLVAHLDVVPASPKQYALKEKQGKLYGRGVYDMKFAAACYLKLVEELQSELDKYDFGIMFTSDEEVGGDGIKNLLEAGYSADVCLLPDGGDNWKIESGSNGLWITKLISNGKSAHGSRPWEGDCAINRLMDVLSEVRDLFGALNHNKSSLTISQISGGTAVNQVADYAEATLDMRFVNQNDYEKQRKALEKIALHHKLDIQDLAQIDFFETDLTNPYIKSFLEIAGKIRGEAIHSTRSLGASDAHYFAKRGIPTILIRPDGGGPHSDEEWIDKAGLEEFYKVLKAFVVKVAKIA